ncbi:MAG: hypothetical protein SXA11_16535 [Cyanobacteriota bacterium]|nr:hypothetical protein [Cyanobacteriota bacterium]
MNATTVWKTTEEIEELVDKFNNCTLPRGDWNHAAHLIVALWYLINSPETEAINRIRNGIKKYNAANGIQNTENSGYHETMTLFWIKVVQQYLLAASPRLPLVVIANDLINTYNNSSLPFAYYSREKLMSVEARKNWVEPDPIKGGNNNEK